MSSVNIMEAERVLTICAACMYCDGLCPVFPALSDKHDYPTADLNYLANLCHNCRSCWYACQYAPPHPFAVNVPTALAGVRQQSYADHVWPRFLRHAFRYPALGAGIVVVVAVLTMLIVVSTKGSFAALCDVRAGPGSFYAVAPWWLMVGLASASIGWAVLSLTVSTFRFWRATWAEVQPGALWLALGPALSDILTLRHLDGGGPGCNDSGIRFSRSRRGLHQLMAAGVVLDFAATLAAAVYQDVLGASPPFAYTSFPVGAGFIGGVAVAIGAAGLLTIEARADREPSERGEVHLNLVFLVALELTVLSGLAVLVWRDTTAMGPLLAFHLSVVIGLFAALPASKALHAPFRAAALLRLALDRQRLRGADEAPNEVTISE